MRAELEQSIVAVVKELFARQAAVELTRPDEQFGDFTTNVALVIAGQIGQNPRQVAEQLAAKLQETLSDKVNAVTVAGPGFLNLTLHDTALVELAHHNADKPLDGKVVVVEYSDPNPFKLLHAGHLYTTLVGDTIARLVERAGAQTIRINYGGDVGLHVGKSMWAIVKKLGGELPDKLDEVNSDERATWLGERYVEGNNAYQDDPSAKPEIVESNKRVYQLHADNDHDSAFARIYWTCRQWSYDYFAKLYEQLQVAPFDRYISESEVTPLGVNTVQEQLEKGVFARSEGAVIFSGEKLDLHTRVFINSEGLPTYEAKDVGLSLTKWNDYHFDESIIITANEQMQYMQVVIAAISQFEPTPAERTRHLTHGIVKLHGGVKMSSREGNIVSANEILETADKAGQQSGTNPNHETILAAVKYAFAKNRLGGDLVYDPKESIALEGNSGPYLQYAHARARSILAKNDQAGGDLDHLEPDERSLLRTLSEYSEVLERATAELMPHHICTYLYELSQTFNSFYEHNRVLGDERQPQRLQLVKLYAETLKSGLDLLGIAAPDRL